MPGPIARFTNQKINCIFVNVDHARGGQADKKGHGDSGAMPPGVTILPDGLPGRGHDPDRILVPGLTAVNHSLWMAVEREVRP